jgi:hypothetical protein
VNSIPGESGIGGYSDKEIIEALEMALAVLFLYKEFNVEMASSCLILHDVYERISKHNGFNFGSMEDIYKNFLKQKKDLQIIKGL